MIMARNSQEIILPGEAVLQDFIHTASVCVVLNPLA